MSGIYNYTVTDQAGCQIKDSILLIQDSTVVIIDAIKNASCFGKCDGKIVITPSTGQTPYSYSWSSGSTDQGPSTLCAGTHTLTITDNTVCKTVASFTVTEPPKRNISAVITNATCNGTATGSIAITASGGTPTYSYFWNNGQFTPTITNLAVGTYQLKLIDGSSTGCPKDTAFSVQQPPPVTAAINTSATSVCFGQSANLTASPGGGTPPYTYLWSESSTTQQVSVSPTVNTTYTVSVTDANSCGLGTASITIAVSPALAVALTGDTICEGETAIISTQASGGLGAPYQYKWSSGATTSSTFVSPNSYPNPTYFSVTATDGCSQGIDSIQVHYYATPQAAFSSSFAEGCSPVFVIFTNTNIQYDSCVWKLGDGTTINGCSVNKLYETPGLYSIDLTLTSKEGCSGNTFSPNYVSVYETPIADFSWKPNPTTVLFTDIEFFENTTGQVSKYNWTFGDFATSALSNPVIEFPQTPGEYPVELIVTTISGCSDTINYTVTIGYDYTYYVPTAFSPNGDNINDFFMPKGVGIDQDNFELRIFNRWGRLIFESKKPDDPWDGKVRANGITGSSVEEGGVYIWEIKIKAEEGKQAREISKRGQVTLVK